MRPHPHPTAHASRALALISVLLTAGCGALERHTGPHSLNPEHFRDAGQIIYFGSNGKPLSSSVSSYELAAAPYIEYDGKRFQTPAGKQSSVSADLKPIMSTEERTKKLHVLINGKPATLDSWSATQLKCGKIFIGGWTGDTSANLKGLSWIFDPGSGKITEECRLPTPRAQAELTLLTDGRVLISGGQSAPRWPESDPLISWELYDPTKHAITNSGSMCRPRICHGVVQLNNGDVFIVDGNTRSEFVDADDDLTGAAEILQLTTGKSHLVGRVNTPSSNPIVIPLDKDQAVVIGGFHQNSSGDYRWVRGAEIFDGEYNESTITHK